MLLRGVEALREVHQGQRALCGFSTYNAETTAAIVGAAELTGLPVLLQAGSSAFRYAGLDALARAALTAAAGTSAQVGVHLDHSRSLAEIAECLRLGYSSVMVDGSHLPFEENVALTCEAVRMGRAAGAWVEGELGAVTGDEDVSQATAAGQMTDAVQAEQFVERTGVDDLIAAGIGGESTAAVRARVLAARDVALERQGVLNSSLGSALLDEHAPLDPVAMGVLRDQLEQNKLSGRGFHRVRRVARTIADLHGETDVGEGHVVLALHLRVDLRRSVRRSAA